MAVPWCNNLKDQTFKKKLKKSSKGLLRRWLQKLYARVQIILLYISPKTSHANAHTHTRAHKYIYIYIYVCVCVCVCVHEGRSINRVIYCLRSWPSGPLFTLAPFSKEINSDGSFHVPVHYQHDLYWTQHREHVFYKRINGFPFYWLSFPLRIVAAKPRSSRFLTKT